MKISFNWLQDFIDIADYKEKVSELAAKLTAAGLEVEDIDDQSKKFQHVVVGKLISVEKHPNADKLTVCSVNTGDAQPRQIVCGAKNHKAGDFVVAALPGAILPGDFAIKKSKIRDVESLGMLCSEKELGLSKESEGILILKPDAIAGQSFAEAFKLDDIILEVNVTPNRADCLSHKGLAHEISTLLNRPMKTVEAGIKESGSETENLIKVKVLDRELCPRYAGRIVKNVKVAASPLWLKNRLESVGVKSINNVVDITNYVLFEYGQPLHAFDYEQIKSKSIVVSKAEAGEKFKSLDGTEITLNGTELLIRDDQTPVALAGVVGGINSGVNENTTTVFIESAFFQSQGVRRTSRLHGIDTDACYRFSRGVNPEQTVEAMNRAAYLLQTLAGGEVQKGHYDIYPQPMPKPQIRIKLDQVSSRLGYKVSPAEFVNIMKRLGAHVETKSDDFMIVTPSAARWDLSIPEDLIEEYARLNGYDKLEEIVPILHTEPQRHDSAYVFEKRLAEVLKNQGLYQAINYAFYAKDMRNSVWSFPNKKLNEVQLGLSFPEVELRLKNPLSEELAYLRSTMLPGLLQNMIHNLRHGSEFGGLFEIGVAHTEKSKNYHEEKRLGLVKWGVQKDLWKTPEVPAVFQLKTSIENLLSQLNIKTFSWQKAEVAPAGFHPGQMSLLQVEGKLVGILGELHPAVAELNKIRTTAALAELNLDLLSANQPRVKKYQEISKFPQVDRDLAFVMKKTLAVDEVKREIKKSAGPNLKSVEVFDLFEGGTLQAGQKSVAFKMIFQSEKETLSDELINAALSNIINSVSQKLEVVVR